MVEDCVVTLSGVWVTAEKGVVYVVGDVAFCAVCRTFDEGVVTVD